MNALLNILKSFGSVVLTLAKKTSPKQAYTLLILIVVGIFGYLFWDKFLDYKLATLERPVPSLVQNEKEVSTPEKVQRITPKVVNVTAKGTE